MHVWKLGPGKLGAIVSVLAASDANGRDYFASKLVKFKALAHITIEVLRGRSGSSSLQLPAGKHAHDAADHDDEECHEGHDHGHAHGHGHGAREVAYAPLR